MNPAWPNLRGKKRSFTLRGRSWKSCRDHGLKSLSPQRHGGSEGNQGQLEIFLSAWILRSEFLHQNVMSIGIQLEKSSQFQYLLREPSEPSPAPIKEPPSAPENPDAPVREPDPEDPGQI